MMRISTKGRYGIKAVVDLALNKEEGVIPLKSIAARQGISENYLEQLLAILRKAGIVRSVRGANGGYYIEKDLSEIFVGDILRALEGSLSPVECTEEGANCIKSNECITKILWEKVKKNIDAAVDSTTLKDLLEEYERTKNNRQNMYYI